MSFGSATSKAKQKVPWGQDQSYSYVSTIPALCLLHPVGTQQRLNDWMDDGWIEGKKFGG